MDKKNIIYYIIFLIIILIYLAVKSTNQEYSFSDENTYFYMGKLVAEGNMPYKDFFLSHPPLQIFFLGLIFKIFGFNIVILKLLPTLFTVITAFFIFLITKKYNELPAILAAVLFFFSYDSLRFSTYNMGVNLALMFMIIGFYLFFNIKNFFVAGLFFGLAGLTRFFSLIPFAVILIFLLLKNKKFLLKFLAGFSITFIIPNLILIITLGAKYITPVFKYHFLKPKTIGERKFEIFLRAIKVNLLLFIPALLFFVDKNKRKIGIIAFILGIYLFFLLLLNRIFGYYFMFLFPFLAILGSHSLINFSNKIKIEKKITYAISSIIIIIFSIYSIINYINYDYQNFNNAEEIAQYINQNSIESQKIFGDDSTAPLLAVLSNRDIALNFADSNNLIFRSKVVDINKVINDLKDSVKFIIIYKENLGKVSATYGPAYMDEFTNFVNEDCILDKTFTDSWQNRERLIEVYDCE